MQLGKDNITSPILQCWVEKVIQALKSCELRDAPSQIKHVSGGPFTTVLMDDDSADVSCRQQLVCFAEHLGFQVQKILQEDWSHNEGLLAEKSFHTHVAKASACPVDHYPIHQMRNLGLLEPLHVCKERLDAGVWTLVR